MCGKGRLLFFTQCLGSFHLPGCGINTLKNVMLLETCHTMISVAESRLKYGNCHDTCPCYTIRFTIPLPLRELIKLVDEYGSHTLIFTWSHNVLNVNSGD